MVTASTLVRPEPSSLLDVFAAIHDSDDKEYKLALDMMQAQRNKAFRLAANQLADIKNVRAYLNVSNATLQR